jgi:hypothetical protein
MWMTVTVLTLSAEGAALAQSAPARACGPNDQSLACMGQLNASVGPEFEAARANLARTPKKGDTGAPLDLNGMADRQAAAGTTVADGLAMPHGAGAPIASNGGGADTLQVLHGDVTGVTSTGAGSGIIVPPGHPQDGWKTMSVAAPLAQTVLRGQIYPAAKSCYESDPNAKSRQAGRLNLLIKLTPAGEVDSVSVLNNAGVSPFVANCIATAAGAAKFAAPGANGAMVHANFTVPGRDDLAPAAATRALGAQLQTTSGPAARDALAKTDTSTKQR